MTRQRLLERMADLATELCIAIDLQAEDIGGHRPIRTIIQELGPLTTEWEKVK